MRLSNKVIKYESAIKISPDFIVPAKTYLPQWYKNDTRLAKDQKRFQDKNIKHCVPFLDALTTGYHIVTAQDFIVIQDEGKPRLEWQTYVDPAYAIDHFMPIKTRPPEIAMTLPILPGFDDTHFVWCTKGAIELPAGYSAIFTHPLNHYDLPFFSLSGVIDNFTMPGGNFPFFLRSDFEGLIPKGTPILQIIPFKRENWESKEVLGLAHIGELNNRVSASTFRGWYKNNHWKQKKYN